MKKIFLITILLTITSLLSAMEEISAGIQLGLGSYAFNYTNKTDDNNYLETFQTDSNFNLGAFLDVNYARLNVYYNTSLSAKVKSKIVSNGVVLYDTTTDFPAEYSLNMLFIQILGKYPIDLNMLKAWPALGIGFSSVISMDANSDGEKDDLTDNKLNDFYLIVGGGLDYSITDTIVITLSPLFSWNLTPNSTDSELPGTVSLSRFHFNTSIALGIQL